MKLLGKITEPGADREATPFTASSSSKCWASSFVCRDKQYAVRLTGLEVFAYTPMAKINAAGRQISMDALVVIQLEVNPYTLTKRSHVNSCNALCKSCR